MAINSEKSPLAILKNLLIERNENSVRFKTLIELEKEFDTFIENHLYELILDDRIFSKQKQKELLKEIHRIRNRLKVFINHPWLIDKVKVAFVGRFNSGKSSVINTLLERDLLPTGSVPTTSIPTYITYIPFEEEEKIYVVDKEKKISAKDFSFLKNLNHKNFEELGTILQYIIDHIAINVQSPLLKNITVVDTPGYDSALKSKDRDLAIEVLKECEVIFWVIDAADGTLGKNSLKILKEDISLSGKKLYFILNKIDRKPPSSEGKLEENLKRILNSQEIPHEGVILFSAKKKIGLEKLKKIFKNKLQKLKIETLQEEFNFIEELLNEAKENIWRNYKKIEKTSSENIEEHYFTANLKDRLLYELDEILKRYSEYDKPLFGKNHYKIYEENWEIFRKELQSLMEISYEHGRKQGLNEGLSKIKEKEKEILDGLLKRCQSASKRFDDLKHEFKIGGGAYGEGSLLQELAKFIKSIFGG